MSKRTLVGLQARMSSNRLPGKVMKDINGFPMIFWQIQRILRSKTIDELVDFDSFEKVFETISPVFSIKDPNF